MTTMRVIKIDFTPSIGDFFANRDTEEPLVVHIHGCMRNGKHVSVQLYDTKPRFWVQSIDDPRIVAGRQAYKIIDCVKDEATAITGEKDIWTIYTKHPADIFSLRKMFEKTFQDNIQYNDAVRAFYGITAFIDVPYDCITGEERFTPDMIVESKKVFRGARDFMFDIETSDTGGFPNKENPTNPVRCLAFQDMKSGVHYFGITREIDEEKVKDMMSSSEWLKQNCTIREGWDGEIKPIPRDKIKVACFDITKMNNDEDPDIASERWLFDWFTRLLAAVKPNRVLGHNVWDFDIDYMIKRSEKMTKDVERQNKDMRGKRLPKEPFLNPKTVFEPIVQVFDTMRAYSSIIQGGAGASGRAALDWMCKRELGYGKVDRKSKGDQGKIDYLYEHDPEYLAAYNIWDCESATRTVEKTDMLEFYSSLTDYNGTGIHNMGSPKKMIVSSMTHRLKNKEVLPTLKRANESIAGGFVADAPVLLDQKMFEVDLSKEYPSVMITLNLCFKTHVRDLRKIVDIDTGINVPIVNTKQWAELLPDIEFKSNVPVAVAPSGNCYRQDIKGVVPQVLKEMAKERDDLLAKQKKVEKYSHKWKILDNQQAARKVSMNSWYGVIAQVYPTMGGDITECAREHIKWIREKTNLSKMLFNPETKKTAIGFGNVKERKGFMKLDFEVVYTDTDSAKCRIPNRKEMEKQFNYQLNEKDILAIGQSLAEKLNKSFGDFTSMITGGYTEEHQFSLKVEEAYKAYLQNGAKKRYAYLTFDDMVQTRGFDTRRSDSTELTKRSMNKAFELLLTDPDNGLSRFIIWLTNFEQEIKTGIHDSHCGKPIGLNSANERTQHYKAAMNSNRILGKQFKVGDKVHLWWVKGSSKFDTEGIKIFALEYGESPHDHGFEVDYETIIQKFVRRKLDLAIGGVIGGDVSKMMAKVELDTPDGDTVEDLF
jgi:DNA polymerase, archaea type